MRAADGIRWRAHARVDRYSAEQVSWAVSRIGEMPSASWLRALCGDPEDGTAEADGNLLVTVGLNLITALIIGGAGTSFAHGNAIVGVGSVNTAASVADTHLGGDGSTSTAFYQQADTGYPTQSNGVITCVSTFTALNANFSWQEWCLATGSGGITAGGTLASVATGTTMLNHKIASLDTKTSGQVCVFTATVTLS